MNTHEHPKVVSSLGRGVVTTCAYVSVVDNHETGGVGR
jgi:hypothetical protein